MLKKRKFVVSSFSLLLILMLLSQTSIAYSNVILKIQMSGEAVSKLQNDLKTLGFMSINPTGYFGNITKSATIKFQKTYGLSPDGIVGIKTFAKIDKLLGLKSIAPKTSIASNTPKTPITYKTSRGDDISKRFIPLTGAQKQWIPGLPKNPYRKGIGKYEGVVLHFTENYNDTAQIEANYQKKNWEESFVHEFIDPYEYIQVANPDYTAWGAGKYANARFIHIELCHAENQNDFDVSFDLLMKRAAQYLYKNKLGVSPAQANGTGSLWSHADVTRYLGGTDHTDPIAYMARYGKTWQDVVKNVTKYYNIFAAEDF